MTLPAPLISTHPHVLIAITLICLSAKAANGFYLGGSIGKANLDEDFDGLNIDSSSTSYGLVGGWRFNEHFALEGGYHDFGDFEENINIDGVASKVSLSADGFTLGAKGSIPIGRRFSLYGSGVVGLPEPCPVISAVPPQTIRTFQ